MRQVPSPTLNAVNLEWTASATDPRRYRQIPGYRSDYTVELLAVQTPPWPAPSSAWRTCRVDDQPEDRSVPDPLTGRARPPASATDKPRKRSIIVTLRRKAFLDYLCFTNCETLDPAAYRRPRR